jgi:hypothetical protein
MKIIDPSSYPDKQRIITDKSVYGIKIIDGKKGE